MEGVFLGDVVVLCGAGSLNDEFEEAAIAVARAAHGKASVIVRDVAKLLVTGCFDRESVQDDFAFCTRFEGNVFGKECGLAVSECVDTPGAVHSVWNVREGELFCGNVFFVPNDAGKAREVVETSELGRCRVFDFFWRVSADG